MSLKHAITFDPIRFSALPDEETYQEHLASYLAKMLQRIRNSRHVTWRRVFNVSRTSCKLLEEDVPTYQEHLASYFKKMLQRIRNILQVTWRRCYNVAGTSCMLLEEDMATYQESLASYFKKMLQRIRNVLQVTWRRCYDVAGTSCLCVHRNMNVITPPHPTGNWSWKSSAVRVSAGQQEKWWGCCAWLRVPKCYPKGMILWCSKWSTFLVL